MNRVEYEQEIEALARTVDCPVCERPAGKPCLKYGGKAATWHSHLGRLKKARGEK